MVVHVAGFWELGWSAPIIEFDHWNFLCRDFGVDKFYMTPISGIDRSKVHERARIDNILEEHKDFQVVFVDERGTEELHEFTHPTTDTLYVFGKANYSPLLTHMQDGDMSLRIDTNLKAGLLWPHQAAAIILYDRIHKWR